MTAHTLRKIRNGRFQADGLGSLTKQHWWSHDADAEVEDSAPPCGSPAPTGIAPTSRATPAAAPRLGEFHKKTWMKNQGPVTWDGVSYEFRTKSGWKSTFALARDGQELATFKVTAFKNEVEIDVLDGPRPVAPGLLLFTAWLSQLIIRDRSAAASSG